MGKKIIRPKFEIDTRVEHIKKIYVTAEVLIEDGHKHFKPISALSLLEIPEELINDDIREFIFDTLEDEGYYLVLVEAEIKFNKDFEIIEDEGITLSLTEAEAYSKTE